MSQQQTHRVFLPDLCAGKSVLVVVVVAQLLAIVLALSATWYRGFSLEHLGLLSMFMQWVALSSAALLCAVRNWLNQLPQAWAAAAVVALVVLNTVLFSILGRMILHWAMAGEGLLPVNWSREALANGLIAAIIAGVVMRYFYVQDQLREKGEAELHSRIQALQSRIRPHFLFNSMNLISSLIVVDPEAAEQAVEDLSKLFRASLSAAGNQSTLSQELDLCKRYARIEALRMGERLTVEWDIRCDPTAISIPLLTLQPLLENAIYHGVQPRPEGGTVRVGARQEDGLLYLEVTNPLPSAGTSGHQNGNRMALENIRHRLQALYGERGRVEAGPDNRQYRVMISYPLDADGQ